MSVPQALAFVASGELARGGPKPVDMSVSLDASLGSVMAPGDEVFGSMLVTNSGAVDGRYAVTSVTTEDLLASEMELTIWEPAGTDAESRCVTPEAGAVLYGPDALGSTRGIHVIGDPAQGEQPGDRTLAAGASEALCFKVTLPLSAGNELQGLTSVPTFRFAAEQTESNP